MAPYLSFNLPSIFGAQQPRPHPWGSWSQNYAANLAPQLQLGPSTYQYGMPGQPGVPGIDPNRSAYSYGPNGAGVNPNAGPPAFNDQLSQQLQMQQLAGASPGPIGSAPPWSQQQGGGSFQAPPSSGGAGPLATLTAASRPNSALNTSLTRPARTADITLAGSNGPIEAGAALAQADFQNQQAWNRGLGYAGLGLQGLQALGGLGLGAWQLYQAGQMADYRKELSNMNLANSATAYNTAMENRMRGAYGGNLTPEQQKALDKKVADARVDSKIKEDD